MLTNNRRRPKRPKFVMHPNWLFDSRLSLRPATSTWSCCRT